MMKSIHYLTCALTFALTMTASSCDIDHFTKGRSDIPNVIGASIAINSATSNALTETKSENTERLNNTFGSPEDGFYIEEYVSDITDGAGYASTRGSVSTTASINQNGQSITVDGWGYIPPQKGKDPELTNYLPKLTASYSSSGSEHWPWVGSTPRWVADTNLHIWSYHPAGAIEPEITINNANSSTASFQHTADDTDLLIAYNNEIRRFETDAKGNHTYNNNGEITNAIIGSPNINVHFYHALASLRFELESTTSGASVHSITICKIQSKNIVSGDGIATSGKCTATGPSLDSDGIVWTNHNDKGPLHFEFASGLPTDWNYFAIPQVLGSGFWIIVEFSKNGSTNYNTKAIQLPSVEWKAGKYYKYKLKIGEFHVPGEKMTELTDVHIKGLKPDHGTSAFKRPETPISIKGVSKMGLIISGYGQGTKTGQYVHMYSNAYAADNSIPGAGDGFQFDFTNYTDINATTISFGNGTTETYYDKYIFDSTTNGNTDKNPSSNGVEAYYVFNTNNKDTFFLYFRQDAQDNSGGFHAFLKGLYVLEIRPDPNVPANFANYPW